MKQIHFLLFVIDALVSVAGLNESGGAILKTDVVPSMLLLITFVVVILDANTGHTNNAKHTNILKTMRVLIFILTCGQYI